MLVRGSHSRRGCAVDAQEALVEVVGHVVDCAAEQLAVGLGEGGLQLAPVLGVDDLPAVRLEHLTPHLDPDAGDYPVEALAVQVDDPEDVPGVGEGRVGDGLPHDALVELGVAYEADEAAVGPAVGVQVVAHVLLGQPGPVRRHRAEPYGARREVDAVGVLGAAGVGLEAVEGPEGLQVLGVQVAQQVLDGVVYGGRVGLDRDAVAGAHVLEEHVGHRGDDGGAGCLVAADLQAGRVGALVVGVVDHVAREPQDAVLYLLEERVVGAGGVRDGSEVRSQVTSPGGLGRAAARPIQSITPPCFPELPGLVMR